MDFEFDKEMDTLLWQAARGEIVSVNPKSEIQNPKSHLDADQIAAFGENLLPEKTKALYIEHFADCNRCRAILSTVISLNEQDAVETIHVAAPPPQSSVAIAALSWYKRLFAAPGSAFAMGAAVLVFAGIIGYTVLQSYNLPQNAEIARIEPTEKLSGPNAGNPNVLNESNVSTAISNNSAATAANSAMSNTARATSDLQTVKPGAANSTNGGSMSNSAPVYGSSTAATANKQPDKKNEPSKNVMPKTAGSAPVATDVESASDAAADTMFLEQRSRAANEKKTRPTVVDEETIRQSAPKPAPPLATASAPAARMSVDGNAASVLGNERSKKSKTAPADSRQIGGKIFKRENGVWYDRSYNGQATTNVSRGSAEFKKLDANIRSIANGLSGALIVVYNGKAYRIQ